MSSKFKTYSELIELPLFNDRFKYLSVGGKIGIETFGFDRIFNQKFYTSKEWKDVRDYVIVRDEGCDLGVKSMPITSDRITVHHMIPLTLEDLENHADILLNPEFLITVSDATHKALHYGDESYLNSLKPIERKPFDMCPWRKQ